MGWLLDDFTSTFSQVISDIKRDFESSSTNGVNIANLTAFAEFDYYFAEQSWKTSEDDEIAVQIQQSALESLETLKVDLNAGTQIRDVSVLIEARAKALERPCQDLMPPTDVDFSDSNLDSQTILAGRTRDCLYVLLKTLVSQLICCNHFASLKLTGFLDQLDDNSPVAFDIYLSSRYDWIPYRWLKTRCIIGKAAIEKEEPGCHIIKTSEDSNKELYLHIKESECSGVQRGQCPRGSSIAAPTVTLGELFNQRCFSSSFRDEDSNCFLPADRVELCYNLGLSLLQLCHSEWRRVSWTVDSIFFLRDPGSRILLEKTLPYLSWRVQKYSSVTSKDNDILPCDPHLLDFARLLMEIHEGERIILSGPETPSKLQLKISALIKNQRSFSCSQRNFILAIEACIGAAGKDCSSPEQIQSFLFRNVILNLEAYRRQFTIPHPQASTTNLEVVQEAVTVGDGKKDSLYDASECQEPEDASDAREAKNFLELMKKFREDYITPLEKNFEQSNLGSLPKHLNAKIKIAIIDSGVNKYHPSIRGARRATGQIKKCRNFLTTDPDAWNDDFGHGTLVSLLLMEVAPDVEIFVAKVSDGQYIRKDKLHCIARAINWAVQVWQVDIISMSLTLPDKDDDIEKELKQAINPSYKGATRKIVFAAAGNSGGNATRGWPASRPSIIAVHATDGQGAPAKFNANADRNGENFATLGRDIKLCHNPSGKTEKEKYVYISGTSYATPIAAGIAAHVLEFARYKLQLSEYQKKLLYSGGCMKKIFKEMMGIRGGYEYVQPWLLWEHGNERHKDICDVLNAIIEEY